VLKDGELDRREDCRATFSPSAVNVTNSGVLRPCA
jgi:hypothetical protein